MTHMDAANICWTVQLDSVQNDDALLISSLHFRLHILRGEYIAIKPEIGYRNSFGFLWNFGKVFT